MDYKKLISSQSLRLKLLKIMDILPESVAVKIQYKIATGRNLNLSYPKRFTEKIQWYKLFYRDRLMTKCSDKYEVREYVKEKGFEEFLVPLYGIYKKADEIDFDKLPEKFVIKTTNGSHTNILCNDKSKLDIPESVEKIGKWLSAWSGKVGREWSYYNIKPKIICEKMIEKDKNQDLVDYKFFCFNGEPYCLYVIVERFLPGGIKLGIFDLDFNKINARRSDIRDLESLPEKPENFDKMIEIAKVLSKDFPHVRVDLYNVDGQIYFGELTFYDGSGYKGYVPDEFDYEIGAKFILPKKFKN